MELHNKVDADYQGLRSDQLTGWQAYCCPAKPLAPCDPPDLSPPCPIAIPGVT